MPWLGRLWQGKAVQGTGVPRLGSEQLLRGLNPPIKSAETVSTNVITLTTSGNYYTYLNASYQLCGNFSI